MADETQEQQDSKKAKTKKINRLTNDELNAKIESMKSGNLTTSKYYKHLMQRKHELGS